MASIKLDDLIKLAKQTGTDTEKKLEEDELTAVQRFVMTFNIKEGRCRVRSFLLYRIYTDWAKDPISMTKFYIDFNLYFEPKKIPGKNRSYYELNQRPWELDSKCREIIKNNGKK